MSRPVVAIGLLLVRWSGLGMAIGLALTGHGVQAAVAMLVALAQVLGWRVRLPLPWEVALSLTCMVAAISSYLDLYARIPWWDIPVHLALTGQLALLGITVLRRRATPWSVMAVGCLLAIAWELLERWGHDRVDPSVYVPLGDTVADIAVGVIGSGLAALLWARTASRPPSGRDGVA